MKKRPYLERLYSFWNSEKWKKEELLNEVDEEIIESVADEVSEIIWYDEVEAANSMDMQEYKHKLTLLLSKIRRLPDENIKAHTKEKWITLLKDENSHRITIKILTDNNEYVISEGVVFTNTEIKENIEVPISLHKNWNISQDLWDYKTVIRKLISVFWNVESH